MVDRETAERDFLTFIEALKIKPRKLEKLEEEKEEVLKGIEYGNIKISEDGVATYVLDEPLEFDNGDKITELTFVNRRITVGEMESKMIGKNDIEKTRRMFAYLTKQNSGIYTKMQADDFMLVSQIAAFFLPR